MKPIEQIRQEIEDKLNKVNKACLEKKNQDGIEYVRYHRLSGELNGLESACTIFGFSVNYIIEQQRYEVK